MMSVTPPPVPAPDMPNGPQSAAECTVAVWQVGNRLTGSEREKKKEIELIIARHIKAHTKPLIEALEKLPRYRIESRPEYEGFEVVRDDTAHYISRVDMMEAIALAQENALRDG